MAGWLIQELLKASLKDAEASRVDCGTCPVSLQCFAGDGGTGWRFPCCGASGVWLGNEGSDTVLVVDCEINRFNANARAGEIKQCPLCNGDVVASSVLELEPGQRYVPTIHAKVALRDRLTCFNAAAPAARELLSRIQENRRT